MTAQTHTGKSSLGNQSSQLRLIAALCVTLVGLVAWGLLWTDLTIIKVYLYSVLLCVCSGIQIARVKRHASSQYNLWHIALAIFFIFTAIVMLSDPYSTSWSIVIFAILFLAGLGGMYVWQAWQRKKSHKPWKEVMLKGMVVLVVALVLAIYWPASIVWLTGIYVGAEISVFGLNQLNQIME